MTPLKQDAQVLTAGRQAIMDSAIVSDILDSMTDSILVISRDGEILYANRITTEILGRSFEDLMRSGLGLLISKDENFEFNQTFVAAVQHSTVSYYTEVDYHHPDGSVKRLAATTTYFVKEGDNESTLIGFVALLKDITEVFGLRRKEQELVQEKQRIDRERIRSLHKLAMGVAHEIRNPMVTIGGFAARILRNEKNLEETMRYAQNIVEEARKLETIVDEIQQYCNLPEMKPSKGEISVVVGEAVSQMIPAGRERRVTVRFHDSVPAQHLVNFDPFLLRMALVHLVKNAIDFSSEGGLVDVSLYLVDEGTVLEVNDSGSGIADQDLEYIFDPFFSTRARGS
ncbi:MAG: two-component system sensor histidine kinase NtrB, partial [Desulfomonilaceae bacterium]